MLKFELRDKLATRTPRAPLPHHNNQPAEHVPQHQPGNDVPSTIVRRRIPAMKGSGWSTTASTLRNLEISHAGEFGCADSCFEAAPAIPITPTCREFHREKIRDDVAEIWRKNLSAGRLEERANLGHANATFPTVERGHQSRRQFSRRARARVDMSTLR